MIEAPAVGAVALRTIGARVQRAIDAGGAGQVIAVFPRSLYFQSAGHLICIGGPALGAGPLNALAADGLAIGAVGVGTAGQWHGAELHLGDDLVLDARAAQLWRPATATPASLDGLQPALGEVAPRGLGRMIPELLGATPFATPDLVDQRLAAGLRSLLDWLRRLRAGDAPIPSGVIGLIGLGSGLTPAGDDALGGALIVLRQLDDTIAERVARQVLPLARERTSTIAYAHLAAAADGEGAAALHDALAALNDAGRLVEALRRLDRIGHSSGWDGLAGAIAALRVIAK